MDAYNGVFINEWKLLVHFGLSAILSVFMLGASAFLLWFTVIQRTNKKGNERIRKLREKAETDEKAKVQLEKLLMKRKRKKARDKPHLIREIAFFLLPFGLGIFLLCVGVIPTLTDYIQKDYVVYSGNFTIEITWTGRHSSRDIILEDGTRLDGTAGLHRDDFFGTVIYAKRSKMTLGAKSSPQN